jgi:membrane protease YdiL (CAAX protease family)
MEKENEVLEPIENDENTNKVEDLEIIDDSNKVVQPVNNPYEVVDILKSQIEDSETTTKNNIIGIILWVVGYMLLFPSIIGAILVFVLPDGFNGIAKYAIDSEGLQQYSYEFVTFASVVGQIIGGIIFIFIFFALIKKEKYTLILKGFLKGKNILIGIVGAIIAIFSTLIVANVVSNLFNNNGSNANQDSLDNIGLNYPVVLLILTVLIAPIVEEICFRYFIFKPLLKKNVKLAYIVSVIAFASIHLINSLLTFIDDGNTSVLVNDLLSLPAYLVPAIILCYIYHRNKNLATVIYVHAFMNLITFFLGFVLPLMLPEVSSSESLIESLCLIFRRLI